MSRRRDITDAATLASLRQLGQERAQLALAKNRQMRAALEDQHKAARERSLEAFAGWSASVSNLKHFDPALSQAWAQLIHNSERAVSALGDDLAFQEHMCREAADRLNIANAERQCAKESATDLRQRDARHREEIRLALLEDLLLHRKIL
jgi:hypothetical protein